MVNMRLDYVGGVDERPLSAGGIVVIVPMKRLPEQVDAVEMVLKLEEHGIAAALGLQVLGMARIKTIVGRSILGDPEMPG